MNRKLYSETDIRAKFITPAILNAGWKEDQISREVYFTAGRIRVKGNITSRGEKKFVDYILYYKPNMPIAIIEAKDNKHAVGDGMQQALGYSDKLLQYSKELDVPFVFSSNGEGFLFHDKTVEDGDIERMLNMDEFPSPDELWKKYKAYKGIEVEEKEKIVTQDYHVGTREPRYYQRVAINRTIEAVANGQERILLVMATGTGKTYTAFQIAYRLWKSGSKRKILFLADRLALVDQTLRGDFRHFKEAMHVIKKTEVNVDGKDKLVSNKKRGISSEDKAYDIHLGLYQGLSNSDPEVLDAFKDFSPDYFDLVIVDECHRGSAKEDSKWREILNYFSSATHIGMTATPKETKEASNIEYFGDPIYTYSLRQGIDDGFLAPYKVIRVTLDIDAEGWRPPKGFLDKDGNEVEDRIYNLVDFDRNIVVDERKKLVAAKITEFLRKNGRLGTKTIVFCVDIEHAEGMRTEIANANADLVAKNSKYVMRITGDNQEGKNELDNFINPEETYPVIATTSKLMTTGVDAQTCKLIVLDSSIGSMTEFKQIIGRGTRINEEYGKTYFTIMDFRGATRLFADPEFDSDPVMIKELREEDEMPNESDENTEDTKNEYEKNKLPTIVGEDNALFKKVGKVYVNGVEVEIIKERVQYMGVDGKLITESMIDYTKKNVSKKYPSIEEFQKVWHGTAKKKTVVEEMEQEGIIFDVLREEVGKDFDPFDLLCHIAYDAKPLTRKERAENVKKRNYFAKYGDKARVVIETLLDKYANDGLLTIESMEVLKISPLDRLGTPVELVSAFGGKDKYMKAIEELELELYKIA